ncbi:MAG: LysR family transcriptional regulator [Xanthobacteraceae bacterium]|nr:LysR family transcriptional regulator [Xanthobacteraceae bacterium]
MATLENIVVFIRVVELGSFSAAGRTLRLSPAVVSYRIQCLERHLGCRLLIRTTRKLQPTEQGRAFYESSLEIRDAVERAEARVASGGAAPPGSLKVTAPLGLGRRVIAPFVPRFRAAHPEIDVRLRLSDYLVDLFTEAVDVAVRMAVLTDSSLIVRKIMDVDRVLCASPAYLSRHGTPRSIKDLDRHQCLLLRFPGSQQYRWPLVRNGRLVSVPVAGNMDADDGDVLTDWAVAGEGIVLKPVFEVAEHLKSGALVPVLPDCPLAPVTLAVLHAYKRMVPVKVRTFADSLVEDVRDHVSSSLAGLNGKVSRDRRAR